METAHLPKMTPIRGGSVEPASSWLRVIDPKHSKVWTGHGMRSRALVQDSLLLQVAAELKTRELKQDAASASGIDMSKTPFSRSLSLLHTCSPLPAPSIDWLREHPVV